MTPPRATTLLLPAALLAACTSVATRLPDVSPEQMREEARVQEDRSLGTLLAHNERLMRVGWPVLQANAELCPRTRPALGLLLHSDDSYSHDTRAAARRVLGTDAEPSVLAAAPNGPAGKAGITAGDVLVVDGERAGGKALRKEVEAADGAPISLEAGPRGATRTVSLTPQRACDYRLRVRPGSAINAYADGRTITISAGMMEFVEDDDELALIIGHELAHNTMGHIRKAVTNYLLSGFATRYTRPFESESDYVGLYYMARAGFDPDGVEDVWRRLAEVDPRSVNRAKTHPTYPDRFLRIRAARDEIEAKRAAGEPLVPNFRDAPSHRSADE